MDVGWNKRLWIAFASVAATVAVLVLAERFGNHGRVEETKEIFVTVLSVTTSKEMARYLVEFPDGQKRVLNGSGSSFYPAGFQAPVTVERFADGTTKFRIARR